MIAWFTFFFLGAGSANESISEEAARLLRLLLVVMLKLTMMFGMFFWTSIGGRHLKMRGMNAMMPGLADEMQPKTLEVVSSFHDGKA